MDQVGASPSQSHRPRTASRSQAYRTRRRSDDRALFLLAQFVVETGYFIFWEMLTGGRSPGKALVGLRVVRRDGLPIDFRSSVVRNVMRLVDMLPANYAVGLVAMLLSDSGEHLGDHAAGTLVIRLDRPEAAGEIQPPQRAAAFSLTRQQLARIGRASCN